MNKAPNTSFFQSTVTLYLFLPVLFFILTWVKFYISIPITLLGIYYFARVIRFRPIRFERTIVWAIVLSLIITLLSGIGEVGYQFNDYEKHNAIYKVLLSNDYPVKFQKDNHEYILCYYVAYYLPPIIVAKLVNNLAVAPLLSFIWGWLGVFLLMFWLIREGGIKAVVLFFFIGGFAMSSFTKIWHDIYHYGVRTGLIYTFDQPFGFDTRTYLSSGHISGSFIYSSNLLQLFWSPQHSIGAWLACMLIYQAFKEKNLYFIFLSGACLLFWTPMIFIGAIPFYAYLLIKSFPKPLFDKFEFLLSVLTFLITAIFFKAHLPNDVSGSIFKYFTSYTDIFRIMLFLGSELFVGLVFLVIYRKTLKTIDYQLMLLTLIVLCLVPFYTTGLFNDFVIRVSTIPLFFFIFIIAKSFINLPGKKAKWVFVLLICLSSYESVVTLSTSMIHLFDKHPDGMLTSKLDISSYKIKFYQNEFDISSQYLGYSDSLFNRYLAK